LDEGSLYWGELFELNFNNSNFRPRRSVVESLVPLVNTGFAGSFHCLGLFGMEKRLVIALG
jgi:hypothetical protein